MSITDRAAFCPAIAISVVFSHAVAISDSKSNAGVDAYSHARRRIRRQERERRVLGFVPRPLGTSRDAHGFSDSDSNPDTHGFSDSDSDSNPNSDTHGFPDSNLDADATYDSDTNDLALVHSDINALSVVTGAVADTDRSPRLFRLRDTARRPGVLRAERRPSERPVQSRC